MKNDSNKDIEILANRSIGEFLKKHMGGHCEMVSTRIFDDIIAVRFKEKLPPAERHLLRQKNGSGMIKELKLKLMEKAAPYLKQIISKLTKSEVVDLHLGFSEKTGEHIEIFILSKGKRE